MSAGPEIAEGESKIVGICAACGRPLTQVGPKGECLRCLVSLGFAAEESGSEQHRSRLTPGRLRYDHFEVEVGTDGFPIELGAGAMAITYRARDTVLNSVVALKVIDRKAAEHPGGRARFLREARAAAQIHHPNVARVSHYGEQDEECFYVMELVEGENLEQRVRREGPMSLALALEIIEQAARALAAAEACGVVHRDIKPSNIMLESDVSGALVVKVIDYGVAKILAPHANPDIEQTQTGFIGTPAFASPEQFAPPNQSRIDTRSDIYSLGVTLWYLLSGRAPFVARTLEEIRDKQTEELPWEQLKGLHIPAQCLALLKSMLAPDPAKRPQSARELLSAVHRCYVRFNTDARSRRKRFALVAGGLLLFLTAIGFGTWLYQYARSSSEMKRSIAVLPFQNLSPNGEGNYFTVGMQDEITSDLARLAGMKVIGAQSTRSYLPGKNRDFREISRDLGVSHLLEGAISRDNDQLRVSLWLVDPSNPTHAWTKTYQRAIKNVFALQSEITHTIATQLQTQISTAETKAIGLPPTTDLQAYELYLRARAVPSARLETEGSQFFPDGKRAISLLEEAIARDPTFVPAYCELAKWHDEFYFQRNIGPPEERAIDHRSLAEAALERARRLQPESGLVHLTLARHSLQISNSVEEADIQIQLARQALPGDAEVEAIAGRAARRQDRWDESIHCLEKAVSLEPRDVKLRFLLASTYRYLRRYPEYDRNMERVLDLTPADKYNIIPIERAMGHLESSANLVPLREAIARQTAAHRIDESDAATTSMILAIWSHDHAAISRIRSGKHDAIGWNGVAYPDAWFEALAARIRGDNAAAVKAFAVARPVVEKRVVGDPTDGLQLSVLAMIDAGLGHNQDAVQEGKKACELISKGNAFYAPNVHCNLATVYAWIGQNDLAIAELTPLIDRPAVGGFICLPTYGDFRLNPLWDPLRNDARFEALVQRLGPKTSQ